MFPLCTDCIGSAFNAKGLMQCPYCRKVEQGQWLHATGPPIPNLGAEDSIAEEEAVLRLSSLVVTDLHLVPKFDIFLGFKLMLFD